MDGTREWILRSVECPGEGNWIVLQSTRAPLTDDVLVAKKIVLSDRRKEIEFEFYPIRCSPKQRRVDSPLSVTVSLAYLLCRLTDRGLLDREYVLRAANGTVRKE